MSDPRAFILADALKALGINPDDNPVYHAKRWIEGRDADWRERDQALTERDNAAARVTARDLRIKDLESALGVIADLVSAPLGCADLAGIYGRVKDICTERDDARAKIASNVADLAARDMRIAELGRDLAARDRRIAEMLPLCGKANVLIAKQDADLAEIGTALDDAGAPKAYHLEDDGERVIPTPERIRLLGERVHTLRAQLREVSDATNYLNALIEAHNALDARGAPRLADGCVLSLAARVRSLPR